MNKNRLVVLLALAVIGLSCASTYAQVERRDQPQTNESCTSKLQLACEQLRRGVKAYRQAKSSEAVAHFRNAVALDPKLVEAGVYLGVALAQQYVPGGDSPENLRLANEAIAAFEEVLKLDAKNPAALTNLAQICYYLKEFEKAKEYEQRRIELDPADPEPYYWIGVLDWAICFPRAQGVRKDLKLDVPKDPKDPNILPPIPENTREKLEEENGPLVEEGIDALTKAIELKPNDFDTMSYLNLMYRQKAEIEREADAREADLKQAEEWVNKALATRKRTQPPSDQGGPDQ
jgi:tetratricopeptide (TPR) repeat protein